MDIFFWAILFRALSGLKNGVYYIKGSKDIKFSRVILMMSISFIFYTCIYHNFYMLITTGILFYQTFVFFKNKSKQIHTTEYLLSAMWTIAMILQPNVNWVDLGLAVYPGLYLFQIPIEYSSYGVFFYNLKHKEEGTVGKVTEYWFFGKSYIIPKFPGNGIWLLTFGIASIILFFINYYFLHIIIDLRWITKLVTMFI